MLPASQRLSTNRLDYLFRKGNKLKNKYFVVKFLLNQLPHSRFAVSVSTTIYKHAVARNRLRRQIYESIRKNMALMGKNYDIFLILQPTIKNITAFSEIEKIVTETLKIITSSK